MATDIRDLRIRIRSDDARRNLNDVEEGVDRIGNAANRVSQAAAGLGIALAGIATGAAVTWFIDTAKGIELMDAQLKTATGSVEAAAAKLGELQEFARQTPFDLEQAVTGFTKLTNLGLNPTIEAMTSFGNTAVAMGKSLEQFVEAVADAVGFEFERLKEFGIKTRQETDAIVFTFQGVTTEVEKSAEAVEEFLTSIGNVQFAGAMEDAMTGITAAVAGFNFEIQRSSSLLVDTFGPAMESIINQITGAIGVINNLGEATRDAFSTSTSERIANVRKEIADSEEIIRRTSEKFAEFVEYGGAPRESAINNFNNQIAEQRKRLIELNEELDYLQVAMRPIPRIFQQGKVEIEDFTPNAEDINLFDQFIDNIWETETATRGATRGVKEVNTELQKLLETSSRLASIREGLAADIGGTLADRLGEEISSSQVQEIEQKLEAMGETIGLDFASRFWKVFANQGEFTLESLIGTFQAWGLEIAQSQVFDNLFADLQKGLGQTLSNLLGGGLAGFGVGATAGGLAGGGSLGLLAGILGGAGTGFFAGGPWGALLGGGLGGLGALLGGGGNGQDQYSFSVGGGLGELRGFAGPDAGNFSQFISFINDLEQALSAAIGPRQLGEIEAALEDFRSAEIRMAEGGFEAERAMGLVTGRLETLVEGMGPGFLRLFRQLSDGTAESTAAAVESLLAVDAAMELFNVRFKDAENIIETAALQGETYAQTLARVAAAQDTLQRALYTAEERQAQTLADAQEQIDEFNESLGLTGDAAIDTREELQEYNRTLDRSQQSQHEALLELFEVAGAFELIFAAAEAAAPAIEETAEAIDELEAEAFDASNVIRNVVSLLNDYVNWQYRLAEAINATTGAMASWELSLAQANDTVALFNTVVAAGGPLESQMQLFNQAFQQFQQAYNQAMQQIAQDLQNRISAIRDEYAQLIEDEREAFDLRRQALQDELEITRAWANTLSSVEGIIASLQSGELSPFGPTGQYAIGASNLAALQAQYAGATGAQQAVLGAQLAQALQAQLGLAQGIFGIGSNEYLEEYNDTITQLTAIQEQAAAEAVRQSELEQALVDLQEEQAARLEQLNQQMDTEIAAAEQHAQNQIDTVNQFAAGVYAEFERVGAQLYNAMLEQMRQQAEFERQGREIQAEQLAALLVIRDGFIAAGLADPTAQARANARAARYL